MDGHLYSSPPFNRETDYFDEFLRLSFENESLLKEFSERSEEVQTLWSKMQRTEKKLYGAHKRRTDKELKKYFECHYSLCKRKYAYKSSLYLHLKTKHHDI